MFKKIKIKQISQNYFFTNKMIQRIEYKTINKNKTHEIH